MARPVQVGDGDIRTIPDEFEQEIASRLEGSGLPDPDGKWYGVVVKAAFNPGYRDLVVKTVLEGNPAWPASLLKVFASFEPQTAQPQEEPQQAPQQAPQQVMARPAQPSAAVQQTATPQAFAPSQRTRVPQQNPADLRALVGMSR